MIQGQTLHAYFLERFGADGVKKAFYLLQVVLGAAFLGVIWLFRSKPSPSNFAVREADRPAKKKAVSDAQDLANARLDLKAPLSLPGIRIDGPPHEVLGVAPQAHPDEIQRAYRERMKQYHPDKIGRQGSREWADAQKIAEAINHAKNEMMKRHRKP